MNESRELLRIAEELGQLHSSRIAAKQVLDVAKIRQLRKDFLTLMGNASRVRDYAMAIKWSEAVGRWNRDFDDYLYKYLLDDFKNLVYKKVVSERDGKYWDNLIRERTWPFVVEFRVPINLEDEYVSKETCFDRFQRELPRWKNRVMAKARLAWKVLEDFVSWYAGNIGDAPEVDVPVSEKIEMEGFAVTLFGAESAHSAERYIGLFRRALQIYRKRANQVYPWLIHNQLPIRLSFKAGLDAGGEYRSSYILINGYQAGNPEDVAQVIAHEMAHHRFKTMGSGEQDFWERMIRGDVGTIDLRDVVKQFPDKTFIFENKQIMAHDPVLYYQLDGLRYNQSVSRSLSGADTVSDIREYLDGGGDPKVPIHRHPISSYASKNAEEAFCEALGMLVAYGPNSLPDDVLDWLRIILPSSRTASCVS